MKYVYRFAVALLLSVTGSVYAGTLNLISDDRRVEVYSTGGNSTTTPPGFFSPWTSPHQNGMLFPTATGGGMTADGNGYAVSDYDYYIQESIFDVTFAISGNVQLDLSGQLSGYDGAFGIGEAKVQLFKNGGLIFSDLGGSGITTNYLFSDIIGTGTYQLKVFTDLVPGESSASWTLDATYQSVVPVPASAWLFGSGLLGLIGAARRKSRT